MESSFYYKLKFGFSRKSPEKRIRYAEHLGGTSRRYTGLSVKVGI
jgi:hypothetical protein